MAPSTAAARPTEPTARAPRDFRQEGVGGSERWGPSGRKVRRSRSLEASYRDNTCLAPEASVAPIRLTWTPHTSYYEGQA
jgi:hypothetical protein